MRYICSMKEAIKKYNQLIILFWIVLYVIFLLQLLPQASIIEAFLFPLCFIVLSYPFTMYLIKKLLPKAIKSKKMGIFVLQFVLFSVIVGFVFLFCIWIFIKLEQNTIFPSSLYFEVVEYPYYFFTVYLSSGVLINLCFCGLAFFHEHSRLEKEHLKSQLQILKGQINPHFMFNVLNHINYYVERKDDLASPLLLKYAEILRYQLYNDKKEDVSLDEEIQFLKNFIDIEKIRWDGRLTVTCSWEVSDTGKRIPPLLLIPLIENSFKHVSRNNKEKGYINIDFKQVGKLIELKVENSKRTNITPKTDDRSGIGLNNLKNRLEILFGSKYQLNINESGAIYYSTLTINL